MRKSLVHNKIRAVVFLAVAFLFCFYTNRIYAQNVWTPKANFGGSKRLYAVGFSIGTKGYIGTGYDGTRRKDFWEWDQASNVWTQKADFGGGARNDATGFSIGTKGYIATGFNGTMTLLKDLWEWDQATNTWKQKANFGGVGRDFAVSFSIGTKGYIGTGRKNPTNPSPSGLKDFWEWDQASNVWTQKADFGGGIRQEAVGFSIGKKGYIGTGDIGGTVNNKFFNDFWEWDQATNTWTKKADFTGGAKGEAVGFSIGNKGYIGTAGKDFWEWDQATDTWTRKADYAGSGTSGGVGFSIGCKGYIGTGTVWPALYNDFWEYTVTPLSVSIGSSGNVSCNAGNDGSATVIVTGGISPYTYKWSSGDTTATAKNLKAGIDTIIVIDASNCPAPQIDTAVITISEPTALSDTAYQTQKVSCYAGNNASAIVIPSGGTKPYTYKWSSGGTGTTENNLKAGTYIITVKDSLLCTKLDSVIISEPTALAVTTTVTDANCNNVYGTTSVTATGGTPPYTYLWNDSLAQDSAIAINLSGGTYNVTVKDTNGCSVTSDTLVITSIQLPSASFIPTPIVGVVPLDVVFTNRSVNAASYLWSYGETATDTSFNTKYTYTIPGVYTIKLIAYSITGCEADTSISITVNDRNSVLWIPNAFTPDEDGLNDVFTVKSNYITELNVKIFDKWGELLYEWNTLNGSWDGTYQGKLLKEDTYVYIIKAKGIDSTIYHKSGHVSLLRGRI